MAQRKLMNELIYLIFARAFNSEWSKNRFLTNLDEIYTKSQKLLVIRQSADKQRI